MSADIIAAVLGQPGAAKRHEIYPQMIVAREIERARLHFNAGRKDQSTVILMQIDGGECLRCNQSWLPVKVENTFAEFTYYLPACKCYLRCWHCGYWLIEEQEAKFRPEKCPNCDVALWGQPYMTTWQTHERLNIEAAEYFKKQRGENKG